MRGQLRPHRRGARACPPPRARRGCSSVPSRSTRRVNERMPRTYSSSATVTVATSTGVSSISTRSAGRSETSWAAGRDARRPGSRSSTTPPRARADGLTMTRAVARRSVAPSARTARSARPSAIWVASAKRCSTASHTSSTEQAQIESWALLRSTSSQAASRSVPGQWSAGRNRADSGSASRSSARSARAAACFTSTRFDATPMRRLARAPERSSPRPAGQVLGGRAVHVLGERADVQLVPGVEGVGLGHHPAEPRLGHEVVGAVHPEDRARRAGRPAPPRTRRCGARSALASSGTSAPLP